MREQFVILYSSQPIVSIRIPTTVGSMLRREKVARGEGEEVSDWNE